jgi:gluconate 2-dehydrogenase gamma chain
MKRRDVLRVLAGATAFPLIDRLPDDWLTIGRTVHAAHRGEQGATLRALTQDALRLVTAACDRIIPADDTPGAVAAGVPAFIDRVLADWCDDVERRRFFDGQQAMDARSRTAYRVAFADASPAQQTALLEELDAELTAWRRNPTVSTALPGVQALPAHGFGMLKFLTIWGYFTSEIGQRDELGLVPRPVKHDGCAPYVPRTRRTSAPLPADSGS